jgi:hypothetical protein
MAGHLSAEFVPGRHIRPSVYRHAGHIWRSHDEFACGDASDGWSEGERWSVNQDALRVSAAGARTSRREPIMLAIDWDALRARPGHLRQD